MTNNEMDVEFGMMMKNKREQLNLSREKMSELVGISTVYCRNIEIGKNCPTWKIWLKICSVLDLNIDYIINIYIRPNLEETSEFLGVKF